MNILLWTLQVLLALHTAAGAAWKLTRSVDQTMPTLKAISDRQWRGMGAVELLVSVCLVMPVLYEPLALLVPIAAALIAVEMVLFGVLHRRSGDTTVAPMAYWIVVAGLCAFVAYGRFALSPL